MEYLYVLDYSDCSISEIEFIHTDDLVSVLEEHGFNPDNCSWMSSENKLELQKYGKFVSN